VDLEKIVEARRLSVAHLSLEHERFEPPVANRLIAAGEFGEICDTRRLEPHEVIRVVRDRLRVGLREADPDADREPKAVHAGTLRAWTSQSSCSGANRVSS
jgi:hypothetical protein